MIISRERKWRKCLDISLESSVRSNWFQLFERDMETGEEEKKKMKIENYSREFFRWNLNIFFDKKKDFFFGKKRGKIVPKNQYFQAILKAEFSLLILAWVLMNQLKVSSAKWKTWIRIHQARMQWFSTFLVGIHQRTLWFMLCCPNGFRAILVPQACLVNIHGGAHRPLGQRDITAFQTAQASKLAVISVPA